MYILRPLYLSIYPDPDVNLRKEDEEEQEHTFVVLLNIIFSYIYARPHIFVSVSLFHYAYHICINIRTFKIK